MKIVLDRHKCTGLGICESLAAEFFEVGDDGELLVLREDVPAELLDQARAAVDGCPTEALRLTS